MRITTWSGDPLIRYNKVKKLDAMIWFCYNLNNTFWSVGQFNHQYFTQHPGNSLDKFQNILLAISLNEVSFCCLCLRDVKIHWNNDWWKMWFIIGCDIQLFTDELIYMGISFVCYVDVLVNIKGLTLHIGVKTGPLSYETWSLYDPWQSKRMITLCLNTY